MQASPPPLVNLTLPTDALQECGDAPLAADGKWATLMKNHVAVAAWGHRCEDRHHGLIDAVRKQQGITINGTSVDANVSR
jgi:hypothetical protein